MARFLVIFSEFLRVALLASHLLILPSGYMQLSVSQILLSCNPHAMGQICFICLSLYIMFL